MLRMPPAPSALLPLLLVCLTASQLPLPRTIRMNDCWHSPEVTNNNNSTEATHLLKTVLEKEDAVKELKREMQELEAKAEDELREVEWMRMNETIQEKEKIIANLETRLLAVEMENTALEKLVTVHAQSILDLTLENQKLVSDFALKLEEQYARCAEKTKELDNLDNQTISIDYKCEGVPGRYEFGSLEMHSEVFSSFQELCVSMFRLQPPRTDPMHTKES